MVQPELREIDLSRGMGYLENKQIGDARCQLLTKNLPGLTRLVLGKIYLIQWAIILVRWLFVL